MIGRAGQWTQTPSTTPLQLKTWNACFCITFNIWCWPGCSMDSHPICHPLPPKKWNAHFWITFNFWWLPAGWWTQTPSTTPLQSKNEILIFGLRSTSDNQPGWSMDSNPICHPSPAKKMKCSFLDYVQLLIIGQAGRWTQTPSASPLQLIKWNAHFWITFNFWWSAGLVNGIEPHLLALFSQKKWNATFWITFNFWWSAGLVNGLEPHPPPLSSQRNEMLIFVLCSTSNDQPGLSMDLNPIHHLSPAKKWNAHILIMFNFWWFAGLVNGLKPHPPPLSSQKKWNACF